MGYFILLNDTKNSFIIQLQGHEILDTACRTSIEEKINAHDMSLLYEKNSQKLLQSQASQSKAPITKDVDPIFLEKRNDLNKVVIAKDTFTDSRLFLSCFNDCFTMVLTKCLQNMFSESILIFNEDIWFYNAVLFIP